MSTVERPVATGRGRAAIGLAVLVTLLSTGVLAVACGPRRAAAPHRPVPAVGDVAATPGTGTSRTLPRSEPITLEIPAIGVRAPVGRLGLTPQGAVEVPPLERPAETGWYRFGPTPGERGPAVILGHVDTKSGPAVFFRLRELHAGDPVRVVRGDGTTAVFRTTEVAQVPKAAFPTGRVYGDLDHAGLRLVTCGGAFDRSRGSYLDNIIVFADLST